MAVTAPAHAAAAAGPAPPAAAFAQVGTRWPGRYGGRGILEMCPNRLAEIIW